MLRPGGLFLAAEPNNFGSTAAEFVRNPAPDWPTPLPGVGEEVNQYRPSGGRCYPAMSVVRSPRKWYQRRRLWPRGSSW